MQVRLAPVYLGCQPGGSPTVSSSREIPSPSTKARTPLLPQYLLDSNILNRTPPTRPVLTAPKRPALGRKQQKRLDRHARLGTKGSLDPRNNRIPSQQPPSWTLPMSLTRGTRQRLRPRLSRTAPAPNYISQRAMRSLGFSQRLLLHGRSLSIRSCKAWSADRLSFFPSLLSLTVRGPQKVHGHPHRGHSQLHLSEGGARFQSFRCSPPSRRVPRLGEDPSLASQTPA